MSGFDWAPIFFIRATTASVGRFPLIYVACKWARFVAPSPSLLLAKLRLLSSFIALKWNLKIPCVNIEISCELRDSNWNFASNCLSIRAAKKCICDVETRLKVRLLYLCKAQIFVPFYMHNIWMYTYKNTKISEQFVQKFVHW